MSYDPSQQPSQPSQPLPPQQPQQPYPYQQPRPDGPLPQYYQQMPMPPRRKRGPLFWILTIVGVVLVLSIAICAISIAASSRTVSTVINNAVSTATTAASSSNTSATHYKQGQTAQVGSDYTVSVNSVKISHGDSISTPAAGNQYLILDVTVKNTSGKAQTISSIVSFDLTDSTGQKYTETITTLSGVHAPDGTVQNGSQLRGQLVYEVPTSMKHYELAFNPNAFSTDQVIWDINL